MRNYMKKIKNYTKLEKEIKTGDVIAFSGSGLLSRIIEFFTFSKYSHVGMAVWIQDKFKKTYHLYIAESSISSTATDISGEKREGMQIVPFKERMELTNSKVWHVKLLNPLSRKEQSKMKKFLLDCHEKKIGYDTDQAISAGLHLPNFINNILYKLHLKKKNDFTSLFCAEVIGASLFEAGRLPDRIDDSLFRPVDIVELPCYSSPKEIL